MSKSSRAGSKRNRRNQKAGRKYAHTPTHPTHSADELRFGLLSLPQELYDMIFAAVFAIPSTNARYNGRLSYKPPIQLQVNRQTREAFSKQYYSTEASWIFLCDWHCTPRPDTIGRWWKSLDKKTKTLLCRTRPGALSSTAVVDAKGVSKVELLRYPVRAPPITWFNFWYRWSVHGKEGIGCLFEILQFMSPSDEYDGVSR